MSLRPHHMLALLLAACAGAPASFAREDVVQHEPPPAERPAPEAPRAPRRFASSPITDFGEGIRALALAAIWHQPLPAPPIEPDRPLGSSAQVVWSERSLPVPRHLDVIAFAMDIEIVLKVGEPAPDAEGHARWGSLRVTIALGENGARLVALRPIETSNAPMAQLPPSLAQLPELAGDLLAGLRRGDLSAYDLTEDDRLLLANDAVWSELQEDRPDPALLREIGELLASLGNGPLGYRLDDLSVLARSDDNALYALSLELDRAGDRYALATSPLVHVRRLWPR
jgi:hypothetical protein